MYFLKRLTGSIFFYIWFVLSVLNSFVLSSFFLAFTLFLKPGHPILQWIYHTWAKFIVRASLSRVSIEGKENIGAGPYIIISNHQSIFDIFIAAGYYPLDFVFFSKKEVFKVPMIGRVMKHLQFIGVDRSNPRAAAKSLLEIVRRIKKGTSVLIYPEGTRSYREGEILPFKAGTLVAARQTKAPLLPILIHGSRNVLPESARRFVWPFPIRIRVLPPLDQTHPLHPASLPGKADEAMEDEQLKNLRLYIVEEYDRLVKKEPPTK